MSQFERLKLTGSPRERGLIHGEAFADAIERNVETYLRRFEHHGADPATVREQAEEFLSLIEAENQAYAAEMRGVADGSGVPLVDVTMLNVRYEVIYTAWKDETEERADQQGETDPDSSTDRTPAEASVDGCTSFGVLPAVSADGKTYMGQNWDWLAPLEETLFLMDVDRENEPDHLVFTEAGIVGGKAGVNEHGIGIAVNGLTSPNDGEEPLRKPFHVRCREVMDAERFDQAILPIVEKNRACSANFLLGAAGGEVINLETAPEQFNQILPEDGVLTHANHFESDTIESLSEQRGPSTLYRGPRLRRLLAADSGEIDPSTIKTGLRDHFGRPSSICSHIDESLPEIEHGQTNASFIIDLDDRRLLAARGPPCATEYEEHTLAS